VPDQVPSTNELLQLADQCVKCGLCLPSCPTYDKARNEADSPRGRIALIQGWLTGNLVMSDSLAGHLDGCLTCRACEAACPSLVAYGRLADGAKARRNLELPAWRTAMKRLRLSLLSNTRFTAMLARLTRFDRMTGLSRLLQRTPLLRARGLAPYLRLAPVLSKTHSARLPDAKPATELDLFLGCTGASIQGAAAEAAMTVCDRLGLRLRILADAECCGALLRHNGYPTAADRHRGKSARLHGGRQIIGLASACIAELREDPNLRSARELCDILDAAPWPASATLHPLPLRVLVHEPCSHRNLLGGNAAVHRLLSRIPELEIRPLPGNERCCGAAGDYLFQQPAMAEALVADKLETIRSLKPHIVVTTNPGCLIHLIAGLQESGLDVEICHPVELIARQMSR
jgi:glycolate oxidase iron-sulfur subunit